MQSDPLQQWKLTDEEMASGMTFWLQAGCESLRVKIKSRVAKIQSYSPRMSTKHGAEYSWVQCQDDHNRYVNWIRNAHSWWTCTTAALLYLESSWPSWWWLLGWQTLGDEVLPLAILSQQMLIDALHRARLGWLYHMQHGITAFCGSKFVL